MNRCASIIAGVHAKYGEVPRLLRALPLRRIELLSIEVLLLACDLNPLLLSACLASSCWSGMELVATFLELVSLFLLCLPPLGLDMLENLP